MGYRKGGYSVWDRSVGIPLGSRIINSEFRRSKGRMLRLINRHYSHHWVEVSAIIALAKYL